MLGKLNFCRATRMQCTVRCRNAQTGLPTYVQCLWRGIRVCCRGCTITTVQHCFKQPSSSLRTTLSISQLSSNCRFLEQNMDQITLGDPIHPGHYMLCFWDSLYSMYQYISEQRCDRLTRTRKKSAERLSASNVNYWACVVLSTGDRGPRYHLRVMAG